MTAITPSRVPSNHLALTARHRIAIEEGVRRNRLTEPPITHLHTRGLVVAPVKTYRHSGGAWSLRSRPDGSGLGKRAHHIVNSESRAA